jgi:hypothetical protein
MRKLTRALSKKEREEPVNLVLLVGSAKVEWMHTKRSF